MPSLRTLLILGRTSNLPTVWSNCLAGWLLGGAGNARKLLPLLLGATLLYLGGMFLNDAFDETFDSQHRRERPIPSGAINAGTVWGIGFGLLAAGLLALFFVGATAGILGLALVICIVVYDAVHKVITLSPFLMAGCRFLLYVIASSAGAEGVTGWAVWSGIALGAYIVGLSSLARGETVRGGVNYWPCVGLATPIFLAFLVNAGPFFENALLLSIALALWIARALRYVYRKADYNVGRAVSALLAGIVLVDLLAVAYVARPVALLFLGLMLLALFLQRFVPAT